MITHLGRIVFRQTFLMSWEDLGFLPVRSSNAGYAEGMLSVTQRRGLTTLVPKPGNPKHVIDS